MNRRSLLRLAGLAATTCLAPSAWAKSRELVAASDIRLQFEGRTALMAPDVIRLAYPGIALRFRARAARLALSYHTSTAMCWVDVSVDGGQPRKVKLDKGAGTLELISGARPFHAVEIIRRSESWMGLMDVHGIELEHGKLVAPPELPPHKLLFIGDSITVGIGTDAAGSTVMDQPAQCNGRLSYGRVLGRRLNAQAHLVAYGGRGIIRDYLGKPQLTAPTYYERALPDDSTSVWDHSRYVPDAVGICLGTNDFAPGIPDEQEFVGGYVGLINKIRKDAPDATIFVIDSPIVEDVAGQPPRATVLDAYLDNVVRESKSDRVQRARVRHYPGRSPLDGHPTGAEHELIANELEGLFRAALKD